MNPPPLESDGGQIMELKIDKEFQGIIPPLSSDEFRQLEANIIADGCREPLTIWDSTIIDGHHRYAICQGHSIHFKVNPMKFDTREDAIIWICQNQRGRRNVTEEQRTYLLGRESEANKKKRGRISNCAQNEPNFKKGRTAEILAEKYGVARETVKRSEQFSKGVDAIAEISPAAKQKILSGQSGATKTIIREARRMEPEQVKELAQQIESGQPMASPMGSVVTFPKADKQKAPQVGHSLDDIIRSIKDPEITADKIVTCDVRARELANHIQVFADTMYDYIDGEGTIRGLSSDSKMKITAAIAQMETAVILIKNIVKEKSRCKA